ncbi:MAG: bifunctional hydroxymethylpyrimidine kinase/phosphomethylpyrimidine kinase [candidate division Zixibacteria bacterium]|nr:bifunctional hydroxymethylpyrimidine kinase/phosphomethylpyrimidine kinase [candidate division Zixibacteria bacterium]
MILALGNPVYDYIETKKIKTEGRILSGCSTNAALALSRFGREVTLCGSVGNDYAQQFDKELKKYNIKPVLLPSEETGGFSLIYYDDFGNRHLDLLGRAAAIEKVDDELLEDSEAVLIGPILKEISFQLIRDIRSQFNGLLFCDPQGLLRGAGDDNRIYHKKPEGIEEVLGLFDIVKPNELEGEVLTGVNCRKDPYEAARIIKSWGPKIVIVTLAELGSLIYDGNDFIEIPPHPVNLLDSTGAGDTYMAGFTHAYLKGESLKSCGTFASCTSSYMIEQVGPDFKMIEEEVRNRQKYLLEKSDFKIQLT